MDSVILGSFLAVTIGVAFITFLLTRGGGQKDSNSHFLAGRGLTGGLVAGSLMLTNLSTEQLVGINGVAFKEGMVMMAWETLAAIALVILALGFLPRYLKSGVTTIPEFLESRFDPQIRTLTSILFLSGYVLILLPIILYSGAIGLNAIFDFKSLFGGNEALGFWVAVWAIGIVGFIYAYFGGMKAIAVSDSLNGVGLFLGESSFQFLVSLRLEAEIYSKV